MLGGYKTYLTSRWSAKTRIPPCILAALSQRPFCSIHIHLRDEPSSNKTITFAALETPTSLSSLHLVAQQLVTLSVTIPATNSAMLLDLGNLIAASSKTLCSLAIHAAGRTRPVSAQQYTTVTDFRWLTDAVTTPLRLRSLTLLNLCMCEVQNGAPITKLLSNDGLRSLHLTCSAVLDLLPDATRLHRLGFRCDPGCKCWTIRAFLGRQRALRELDLLNDSSLVHAGAYQDPRELLRHLGRTLEVLNTRADDRWPEGCQARAIDEVFAKEELLQLLGSCCGRLRDVGIVMPRADAHVSLAGTSNALAFFFSLFEGCVFADPSSSSSMRLCRALSSSFQQFTAFVSTSRRRSLATAVSARL